MKSIPLPQGKYALVDDGDFDRVSSFKWSYQAAGRRGLTGYAVRQIWKPRQKIYLHRLIMDALPGTEVDHINGNGLDCRKANLRICSRAENVRNKRKHVTNTTYKGVRLHRRKWVATICINRQIIRIGAFSNAEDAARAYDAKARELFGEFAKTNFTLSDR